jgi:predicted nucleotidyltransferase component of viral defense system
MTGAGPHRPRAAGRIPGGANPGVLSVDDLRAVVERFGAAEDQVRRDHAISHVLWAISEHLPDAVIFFGGTALSRTHLVHARLSEDVDLISTGPRREVAEQLVRALDSGLRRTLGRPSWNPGLSEQSDVTPGVLEIGQDIAIKVQLLDGRHYSRWPVERRELEQRYADALPAELTVPTVESFVGWKTDAWHDRGAARDLYDLWALAEEGHLSASAAGLFARYGPTGGPPREFMFRTAPPESVWRDQLAGQTRLTITAARALEAVRAAWAVALDEDWSTNATST